MSIGKRIYHGTKSSIVFEAVIIGVIYFIYQYCGNV